MLPTLRTLLALIMLLVLASPPAGAQAVRGSLRDADRNRPLSGARLFLLSDAGVPVDSAASDAAGRFRLTAPAPGDYTVHFQMDGWAGVPSDPLRLDAGATVDFEFRVPLISNEALAEISDLIGMEPRLQEALPEICGEAFRPWEAGLLVGRVRDRATSAPIAGARVAAATTATQAPVRATVSSANGVYILCNVPVGNAVSIIIESPQGARDTMQVEIRAGTAAWYDLFVSNRRP